MSTIEQEPSPAMEARALRLAAECVGLARDPDALAALAATMLPGVETGQGVAALTRIAEQLGHAAQALFDTGRDPAQRWELASPHFEQAREQALLAVTRDRAAK